MKGRLKIQPGVHIPFEKCEKCIARDECPGAFDAVNDKDNSMKEEIRKYLIDIGINVFTYDTPHEMVDKIGISIGNLRYDDGRSFKISMHSNILILSPSKNKLEIVEIDFSTLKEMYEELKKDNKITPLLKIFFG